MRVVHHPNHGKDDRFGLSAEWNFNSKEAAINITFKGKKLPSWQLHV